MEKLSSIKVLFLSEQRLLREAFAEAFSGLSDIKLLAAVDTVEEAITSMLKSQPDVILVDINPSLFGRTVAKRLQVACPGCKIILLASHSDEIAEAYLIAEGVKGVLSKNIGIHDLGRAIRQVYLGNSVCMSDGKPAAMDTRPVSGMTEREAQVLVMITQGLANKQIAAELGISTKTVEKHRQRVMSKLQTHETAGLTWRAICMGVARSTPCLAIIPT
ncbi:MAG: response regulator transcription factor [Verrucomicrobiota bacterium]|nr:response regulator transcription factor [Verrucomicrobiota bacterium]